MGLPSLELCHCRLPGMVFPSSTNIAIGDQRGGRWQKEKDVKIETKAHGDGERQSRGSEIAREKKDSLVGWR